MKKLVLNLTVVFSIVLFQNRIHAQWIEHQCDYFIDSAQNFIGEADMLTLSYGTQEIVEDPDDPENHFWKLNVHTGAADVVKYIWYPQYFDGINKTWVPAPSTLAIKFRWIDSEDEDIEMGPEVEMRGVFKIMYSVLKGDAGYQLEVRDWNIDSTYNLPEDFDPTDWHVLRSILNNDGTYAIYLDETSEAFVTGTGGKQVDKHFFIIGAWNNSGQFGAEIDWIGVKDDAAWSPDDQALPEGVWGDASFLKKEKGSSAFRIYPNPAVEFLTIAISDQDVRSRYEILSITGQTVKTGVIESIGHIINVSEFDPGLYLMKVETAKETQTRLFIVE